LSQALVGLRQVLMAMGEFARTRDAVQESAAIARDIRDDWGLAMAQNALGELARSEGDYAAALSHYAEAIDLFRKARARINENISVLNSVVCHVALGQAAEAARLLQHGAQEAQNTQSILLFVNTLFTFGIFATAHLDDDRVTRMGVRALGSDMAFLTAVDARLDAIDQAAVDNAIKVLKARLGEPHFVLIWADGGAIPPLDAVNECLATLAALRESSPDAHRGA
jgi:tetratricopeptide (TPR) repeat protein